MMANKLSQDAAHDRTYLNNVSGSCSDNTKLQPGGNINRRKCLKGIGHGALGIFGIAGYTGNGRSLPSSTPLKPGENDLPHGDVKRTIVSENLRKMTPYWYVLSARRDLALKRLLASTLSDTQIDQYQRYLKDLWRTYPTERIESTDRTEIRLENQVEQMARGDHEKIERVAGAIGQGASVQQKDSNVSPQWFPVTHRLLAEISAGKMGVTGWQQNTIRDHADDSDFWEPVHPPSTPWWLEPFINQIAHSYTHYWNPNNGFGDAPSFAESYLDTAESSHDSGDISQACKETAWASHYIIDVGQPLHTGAEIEQLPPDDWVHDEYEDYIAVNWDSGYHFRDDVMDSGSHYQIIDPNQAVRDLAQWSNQHCYTVFDAIYNYPNTWGSIGNIIELTRNCLVKSSQYNKGFVRSVFW